MPVKIEKDVLDVLVRSKVEGNVLFLPPTQLDRNLYVKVNKSLESIGGKWNRQKKGHIFDFSVDVSDLLDDMINSGEYTDKKKELQFFETPENLAKRLVELSELESGLVVLEPSFGKGRIINQIPLDVWLYGIEIDEDNFEYTKNSLGDRKTVLICADFLVPQKYDKQIPESFDRIIMNPPFSKHQDIKHIFQAWDMLAKDGVLVSIVSESPFFREDKISLEFRNWLDENNAEVISLDSGEFKESGTMVKTRIIKVRK